MYSEVRQSPASYFMNDTATIYDTVAIKNLLQTEYFTNMNYSSRSCDLSPFEYKRHGLKIQL